MKVLLADNSRTVRVSTRESLVQLGHKEVVEAKNAEEVLNQMAAFRPDLVIVDPKLAGSDGTALITRLREIDSRLPIILSTTAAEKGRVAEAVKAGATTCLFKPFTTQVLAETIIAAIRKQAAKGSPATGPEKRDHPGEQAAAVAENPLRVVISEDRLKATLVLRSATAETITSDNIAARLKEVSCPVTDEVAARISKLLEMVAAGRTPEGGQYVIAEGRPPIPGAPAGFQVTLEHDDNEAEGANAHIDLRKPRIATVEAGQAVGVFSREVRPVPGVDVFNKPIPAAQAGPSLSLGKNLRLAEDGKTVVAAVGGKLQFTRQDVSVTEVLEIKGDIDYATGNIDTETDVLISGTIGEGFSVRSSKSISVRGTIEAAVVEAGTHVHVAGGIITRHQGRVVAGGEICAKFCEDSSLKAAGDIVIARLVMNSRVEAGGRLVVPRGQVIGGTVAAVEGVEVKQLGNDAYARTEVRIGRTEHGEADTDKASIQQMRDTAAGIRSRLEPVMGKLDRMPPLKREQVDRLLHEAVRLEAAATELEKRRAEKEQAQEAHRPSLVVTGRLYPGVAVSIGDKMSVIDKERQGPLRIERRPVERVEEIVMVDQVSGSVYTLHSWRIEKNRTADPTGEPVSV